MPDKKERRKNGLPAKICGLLLGICLTVGLSTGVVQAAAENNRNLLNGSFEEGQTFTDSYSQPDQSAVPSWNTTAFQGKIELFRKNTGTYITNVTLAPTAGNYAAELNADEESTLYQNVKTTPSSVYKWGLDHGARTTMDTIALVIGPKQSVEPSKPSKDGRDQLMQMVDWLSKQYEERGLSLPIQTSTGENKCIIVYSKKFAASGTFEDNVGNNAFSLTPSTIYTEEWHIWIIQDSRATNGENPWGSYGSNTEKSAESTGENDSIELDLSKYYLYTVPAGQTETVFGFVSVGCEENKGKTFGNFLDNINFDLYHPLSGSSTIHGSVVIGGSDGTAGGVGATAGHKVTVGETYTTYVTDNETLKIQAIVKAADAGTGCEFIGLYHTEQDENGNPVTSFLKLAGNVIKDNGSLTTEQKKNKWVKSTNTEGDIIYTYYLDNLTSPTDLHFAFIKSPTITYDPNGGKDYMVERTYNTDEAANVYSYRPASGHEEANAETGIIFIDPYVSHAAEGQNDGWKFMGWLLTGDTVENIPTGTDQVNVGQLGSLILPVEHTIACDYAFDGVNEDSKAQYFKIYDGNVSLTKTINRDAETNADVGVTWTDNGETKAYANVHKGLTMVAQWRWRQAFIPQVGSGTNYTDSGSGGTVEITSVTDPSDTNYNAAYNADGGKSYHAETDETITATATAKTGYTFEGWYDKDGNLLTKNATYKYTEAKESVNTYYARFSETVTQTYIRQVKDGDNWKPTDDDSIGTLGRYTYTDAVGTPISSTATAGTGYKFVGWYDSEGNGVTPSMLINGKATISYITTDNATYYARFIIINDEDNYVTQTYIRQVKNGDTWENTTNDTIGTLTNYSYTDTAGTTVSSTATAGTGYKFEGWYDSGGHEVADDILTNGKATISYTTTGNATYYARFRLVEYTVAFEPNGGIGTMANQSFVYGTPQQLDTSTFSRNGYTFIGWNTVADGSGTAYADEESVNNLTTVDASTITLYAQWSPNTNIPYTVNHYQQNLNDDGYTLTDTENLFGATGATATATPKRYTGFTENMTYSDRVASGTIAENGSLVLKLYYDRNLYTVTYDLAGGSTISSPTTFTGIKYGAATPTIANPTREGFVFTGWNSEIAANVTDNATYTAQWEADNWKDDVNGDSETGGDGTPDSRQALIKYQSANPAMGAVTPIVQVQTLAWDESAHEYNGTATTGSHATAGSGYVFDYWLAPDGATKTYNAALTGSLAVLGGQTYPYTAYFDQDRNSDGIPDKYQVTVTYRIVNGTWDGTNGADRVEIFSLKTKNAETGLWEDAHPVLGTTIPTGMVANVAYSGAIGSWGGIPPDAGTEVTGNMTYTYTYGSRNTYSISVTVTGGTADPAGPSLTAEYGTDKTITFTANENYVLDRVTVNGTPAALDENGHYTFENVTADQTIQIVYKLDIKGAPYENGVERGDGIPDEYQVFVRYEAGANGSLSGETYKVYDLRQSPLTELKTSVDLTLPTPTADSGYRFSSWTEPGGVTVENSTISGFTPGETYTFTANFTRNYVPPVVPNVPDNPDEPDDPDDSDDPDVPSKPPVVPVIPSKPELNADDHMAYIRGYADGTVRPNNFITRAQVATIFYRLMTDESQAIFFSETNDYSDISADYWANQAISTLSGTGVLTGFTDGTFRPDAYITRAQFAAIAARFSTVTMGLRNPFSDVPQGYWAEDLIAFAAQIGWIDGYADGSFHPDDHITRAAVMKLINNMLDRHVDAEGLPENVVHWSDCSPDDWYYYIVMEATNAHDHERRSKDSLLENWTLLTDDGPVQEE